MATLTPGILLKLLQSMSTNTKPTGEHRSPLLQVTAILPIPTSTSSLSSPSTTPLDLFPNNGFLLQLSDSKNSTYVSLTPRDTDLVLSNRIQLGQFVYLDRFVFDPVCSPLPFASGVRPLQGRHPFVGSPQGLIVRVSDDLKDFVVQPVGDGDGNGNGNGGFESVVKIIHSNINRFNCKGFDFGDFNGENDKENDVGNVVGDNFRVTPRRFASPGVGKRAGSPVVGKRAVSPATGKRAVSAGRREKGKERDESPALVVVGKGKRSASPVPSKCVVPSLVAAKESEEMRKVGREAAIVVPSRYKQASPTVGRRAGSPAARRMSLSPARRLSGGGGSVGGRKKSIGGGSGGGSGMNLKVVVGEGQNGKSGSGGRKSWDEGEVKEKSINSGIVKNKPDFQAIIRTQVALSRRLSDANSHESKDDSSLDGKSKTSLPEDFVVSDKPSALVAGIAIHDKKWTDGSVSLDSVSSSLAKLGKEAIQRRAIAANAAAEALQEALATESIVRSLSMFSDLCSASKAGNPLPTIDRFLTIYDNASKSAANVELVSSSHCSETQTDVAILTEQSKSASAWVEAALSTDLAVVSLLTGQQITESLPLLPKSLSSSKRQSVGSTTKNHSKTSSSLPEASPKRQWTRGLGMRDTIELASNLKSEMEIWFLKFVEESLDAGFRVFSECGSNGSKKPPLECGSIAAILSQLKRINDWLDIVVKKRDQVLTDKIEKLKRKIYGFVIQHVGTTFDNSPSISTS